MIQQHLQPAGDVRRPRRRRRQRSAAFTLIEIITVVVIIAVIMAIALPMLSGALKKAKVTRQAADLAAIKTGLDAYVADFGDIPRPEGTNNGFAMLGKAMLSPGASVGPIAGLSGTGPYAAGAVASTGTPGPTGNYQEWVACGLPDTTGGFRATTAVGSGAEWSKFPVTDGKDGPGFRARPGGRPYPPYLQETKFRLRGLAILDAWDNPILYFTKRPGVKAESAPAGPATYVTSGGVSMYNADQNLAFFMRHNDTVVANALKRMQALLEITSNPSNIDGKIDSALNEKPATTGDVLLWSAGANHVFGPNTDAAGNIASKTDIEKCDDITNFTTGQ